MNLFADEGVDRHIVDRIREDGHKVVYVAEMAPGIPDEAVLDMAARGSAVLITADKDFGEIVFRQGRSGGGVLLTRLQGLSPEGKARAMAEAITEHGDEMIGSFSVLSPGTLRVRRRLA